MSLEQRFSGHESFVCRYGWLSKVYRAVSTQQNVLKDDLESMGTLGIGRNMVKSIQFWGEATGVIEPNGEGGHQPGPVGLKLMSAGGWDPYLESLESLWLIHWWLASYADMAAWNEVFAEDGVKQFDRKGLIDRLTLRASEKPRPLASSTLEQHASIFLQSYLKEERSNDDTSWCPLQDLGLLTFKAGEDGKTNFQVANRNPQGLTLRVFAVCVLNYVRHNGLNAKSIALSELVQGVRSPGRILCLDELLIRRMIDDLAAGLLQGCLRFNDTADTQSIVVTLPNAPEELLLVADYEALNA
ncbi:DUF4007 family protein [Xylophilus sp. GW821-FHT01B05]